MSADPLARLEAVLAPDVVAAIVELVEQGVAASSITQREGTPWFTLDEAADYLRVSPRTLERSIARGRLRSMTLGRRRLVHRDDLDALASGDGGGASANPLHSAAAGG